MSRSDPHPRPDPAEPDVRQIDALYREAATDEPGPALDRSILDAARVEVLSDRVARRRTPWWKGWMTAASAVAVAAVGLSLTWRVMDEQERRLREETSTAQAAGEAADKAAAKQRSVVAGAASNESALARPLAESQAVGAAPATMAPLAAEEAAKKGKRAEADTPSRARDASLAEEAASGLSGGKGKTEARSFGASSDTAAGSSASPAQAQPAGDLATMEAWLREIRQLRAAGRNAEAVRSLARLRERYPDLVLPDDLLN